jgi:hypothetical protein
MPIKKKQDSFLPFEPYNFGGTMLIKDHLFVEEEIDQINHLLSSNVNSEQKFLLSRELLNRKNLLKRGQHSTHFINFFGFDSRSWAVIHDLRISHNGFVEQIDHILINRYLDIIVIEAKNFSYSLKITADGDFLIFDGHQYQQIESPIEKNEGHILLLEQILIDNQIMPKKFGIPIKPHFQHFVLVSPLTNVLRPPSCIRDTSMLISADVFAQMIFKKAGKFGRFSGLARFSTAGTLSETANRLVSLHDPDPMDYAEKFGIKGSDDAPHSSVTDELEPVLTCDYCI